jgi:hypothetical protein
MNARNQPVQRVTPWDYVDRLEGRPPPWRRLLVERAGSYVTLGTSGRRWWIASPRRRDGPTNGWERIHGVSGMRLRRSQCWA